MWQGLQTQMSQAKTFECYPDVFESLRRISMHLKEPGMKNDMLWKTCQFRIYWMREESWGQYR